MNDDTKRLAEIAARAEAATAGPWKPCAASDGACHCGLVWAPNDTCVTMPEASDAKNPGPQIAADAAFIAHAREDIPCLLAMVERLTQERDEARGLRASEADQRRWEHEELEVERAAHAETRRSNEEYFRQVRDDLGVPDLMSLRDGARVLRAEYDRAVREREEARGALETLRRVAHAFADDSRMYASKRNALRVALAAIAKDEP